MNKARIIGRFYFKQTKSGNLIGEFSNNMSPINLTECSNINSKFNEDFCGDFKTIWFENKENLLNLKIERRDINDNNIYKLTWSNNGGVIFWGEGFIVDDILIGDYRNFEKIQD
jgi:hypothetical protein